MYVKQCCYEVSRQKRTICISPLLIRMAGARILQNPQKSKIKKSPKVFEQIHSFRFRLLFGNVLQLFTSIFVKISRLWFWLAYS